MSVILTGLPAYVEERRLPLIKEAVLKAKTASLFNLQSDIKTSAALNLLQTDVEFGDGLACGWEDKGTSTLSQRILTTGHIKVNRGFCEKDFLKYWTGYQVRVAAGQQNLPFEEYFVSAIVENVKAAIEKAIWQGDTASSDNKLKWFDGMLKILGAAEGVVSATTAASAYDAIKNVYLAIPEKVLDKAVIFVGADTFRTYMQEMVEKNYYHYAADGMPVEEFILPGSNTRVIAVNGLNGTGKIVAGSLDNMFYGCDMMGDEEKFEMWYSQDFREYRLAISFNAGVQVAFPDEIVVGGIA
jgi:hypothetical protein